MGLKEFGNNILSYFSTDEVSELEEFEPVRQSQPAFEPQEKRNLEPRRSQAVRTQPTAQEPREKISVVRPTSPRLEESATRTSQTRGKAVTIALKYPRKYEDAREIVALLNSNECVLIDFQYMLETQARRCLDFIDGASEVLSGNLQKVGSSMYLLTPSSVVVDVEEMQIPNTGQELAFDYDMKRR